MRKEWGNGLWTAILAFGIWGLFPVYWKQLHSVPAGEILAHRIFGSFAFMLLLIVGLNIAKGLYADWQKIVSSPKMLALVALSSVLISANWLVFTWAVIDARILETSLGYYINPLVNMLLGTVFLREEVNRWQTAAIILAVAGVGNLIISLGTVPWVSLALAFSMGFYGLCKKLTNLNVFTSLTVETAMISPFAFIYLGWLYYNKMGFVFGFDLPSFLLLCAGAVTSIPLLLFANSAQKLPMTVLGFTQYLTPTLTFLLGTLYYQELFTKAHFISFALIWGALIIFSLSSRR